MDYSWFHLTCNSSYQDINKIGFSSYYDFVFSQYSKQFKLDLIEYGREFAEQLITKKRYHLFDPVISDCACQMRAIWLCCFLQSVHKIEDLSIEDLVFFGLSRLLSESAICVKHDIIGIATLKTQSSYWPQSIEKLQNKLLRERFYGEAKALVAKRVLNDLSAWFLTLTPDDLVLGRFEVDKEQCYQELCMVLKNFEPSYSYSQILIPVLHTFPGFILMMTLAAHFGVIISVIFRKISRNPDGFLYCQEGNIFHFRYNKTLKIFENVAVSDLKPDDEKIGEEVSKMDLSPEVVISSHGCAKQDFRCDRSEPLLESMDRYFEKNFLLEECVYSMISMHDKDIANHKKTLAVYPVLAKILKQYMAYSEKTGLKCSDTVRRIYDAMQTNSLIDLCIVDSVLEFSHVYADSLLQGAVGLKK